MFAESVQYWWSTVPEWAKPVVLGFALTVAWGIVREVPGIVKSTIRLWKWAVGKYDRKVFAVVEGREKIRWRTLIEMDPISATFVSKCVGRKPKSVLKSLERLEREGKIHQGRYGWCWGPRIIPRPKYANSDKENSLEHAVTGRQ